MGMKLGLVATANVEPYRVLALNTSAPFKCAHCGANARGFGVSQGGSKYAPTPGAATLVAETGDPVAYHDEGEICLVEYGGTVTIGALLESDSNGKAVVAGTNAGTVREIVGVAMEAGASGHLGKVKLKFQSRTIPA